MKNKVISISLISATILFSSFISHANDCAIKPTTKESLKCLQQKIVKLESKLKKEKQKRFEMPKGAVIEFNSKTCPENWRLFESEVGGIVTVQPNNRLIKCEKE